MAIAKKRKKFFDVEIPLIRKETQAIAYTLEGLDGRHVSYDLTRILRGKGILLQAKIKVENDQAIASPTKIHLMPFFLKRMVRKGTNYVEDSFSTETKDAQVRIKPFLVTRRKVSRAVRKALREKAREELIKYLKTKKLEEVFQDILKNILQKTLSLKLKKVYPLSSCEIKSLRLEKELEPVKKETKKEVKKTLKKVEEKKE